MYNDNENFLFQMAVSIAVVIGVLLFGGLFIKDGINLNKQMTQYSNTAKVNLQSIDLQTQLKGRFTYGSGNIQEDEYYVVYEVQEDGGLSLAKYKAKDTILYPTLDDNTQAYVEKDLSELGYVLKYRMYIPKNSVEKKYDLALGE